MLVVNSKAGKAGGIAIRAGASTDGTGFMTARQSLMKRLLLILVAAAWAGGCESVIRAVRWDQGYCNNDLDHSYVEGVDYCTTDRERQVCGQTEAGYVISLKEEIQRNGWNTEEDALRIENNRDDARPTNFPGACLYEETCPRTSDCLAGLIRLSIRLPPAEPAEHRVWVSTMNALAARVYIEGISEGYIPAGMKIRVREFSGTCEELNVRLVFDDGTEKAKHMDLCGKTTIEAKDFM